MILQSQFPYHVTGRCRNKEWFKIPMESVWLIFSDYLFFIHHAFDAKIHGFVLMNNHFHLIISTPNENLSEIMAYFMRSITRSLNLEAKRINQAFGGRYFRTIIGTTHYYTHAYKYMYRNPCEAGLIRKSEDYQFSSLNFLVGKSKATFPVLHDDTLFSDLEGTLNWLNKKPLKEHWIGVENALNRSKFTLAKKYSFLEKHRL